MSDSSPPDIGDEWQNPIARVRVAIARLLGRYCGSIGGVDEHRPPPKILARDEPPVSSVLRAIPIVSHHEVLAGGGGERAPVVVLRGRGGAPAPRRLELVCVRPRVERAARV